ncbi:hypothetical protein PG990_003541 [Apiospora arundinis]
MTALQPILMHLKAINGDCCILPPPFILQNELSLICPWGIFLRNSYTCSILLDDDALRFLRCARRRILDVGVAIIVSLINNNARSLVHATIGRRRSSRVLGRASSLCLVLGLGFACLHLLALLTVAARLLLVAALELLAVFLELLSRLLDPNLLVHQAQPLVLAPPARFVNVELAGARAGRGALHISHDLGEARGRHATVRCHRSEAGSLGRAARTARPGSRPAQTRVLGRASWSGALSAGPPTSGWIRGLRRTWRQGRIGRAAGWDCLASRVAVGCGFWECVPGEWKI